MHTPCPSPTYHVLHVGGRGVHLASELVVKLQDELSVAVPDGSPPPLLGLPPVAVLVQVLVQDLLPARGVGKHRRGRGGVEHQEHGGSSRPAWSHPRRWCWWKKDGGRLSGWWWRGGGSFSEKRIKRKPIHWKDGSECSESNSLTHFCQYWTWTWARRLMEAVMDLLTGFTGGELAEALITSLCHPNKTNWGRASPEKTPRVCVARDTAIPPRQSLAHCV